MHVILERLRVGGDDFDQHRGDVGLAKGRHVAQEFVEHGAQAEDVRAVVGVFPFHLFGRGVAQLGDEVLRGRRLSGSGIEHPAEMEAMQLDLAVDQHDFPRHQRAMEHARFVGAVQRVGHLGHDFQFFLERHDPLFFDDGAQAGAVQRLDGDVEAARLAARSDEMHDVGVLQTFQGVALVGEQALLLARRQRGGNDLQGNALAAAIVGGVIEVLPASLIDALEDLKISHLPGHFCFGRFVHR